MMWEAISEYDLWSLIIEAEARMSPEQARFWSAIKILPEKWSQTPYGDVGGGFWVVGVIGGRVLWYNDIEGGFNLSKYQKAGVIAEYWCNQDELEWAVQSVINLTELGYDASGRASPPQALTF